MQMSGKIWRIQFSEICFSDWAKSCQANQIGKRKGYSSGLLTVFSEIWLLAKYQIYDVISIKTKSVSHLQLWNKILFIYFTNPLGMTIISMSLDLYVHENKIYINLTMIWNLQ
jgi:hypothetical protein